MYYQTHRKDSWRSKDLLVEAAGCGAGYPLLSASGVQINARDKRARSKT
jgi:hypothetical protein